MTLRDALLEAATHIARRDAETLLAHILHRDRAWLLAHIDDDLSAAGLESLRALTARRVANEPLQYLTGTQEFFGLTLRVTPDVLIPRPETEHLVEAVLDWARHPLRDHALRIVDLGTGSGAIAIALASVLERDQITAIDISPAALAVARANAENLHLCGRITFLEADLLDPFQDQPASLDAVVANLPYVPEADALTLAPEVRDHEPHLALFAGRDGLALFRRLIPQAFAALRPGGLLALEFGFGQREALALLLHAWDNVRFLDDYAAIPRIALATRP